MKAHVLLIVLVVILALPALAFGVHISRAPLTLRSMIEQADRVTVGCIEDSDIKKSEWLLAQTEILKGKGTASKKYVLTVGEDKNEDLYSIRHILRINARKRKTPYILFQGRDPDNPDSPPVGRLHACGIWFDMRRTESGWEITGFLPRFGEAYTGRTSTLIRRSRFVNEYQSDAGHLDEHIAVASGDIQALKSMHKNAPSKSDPDYNEYMRVTLGVKDKHGRTPLDLARQIYREERKEFEARHKEIIALVTPPRREPRTKEGNAVSMLYDCFLTILVKKELKKGVSFPSDKRYCNATGTHINFLLSYNITPNELRGFGISIPRKNMVLKGGFFTVKDDLVVDRITEKQGQQIIVLKQAGKNETVIPNISGKVVAVSLNEDTGSDELVMLSAGRQKSVKRGYRFTISRNNIQICVVEIMKVFDDSSVGKVIPDSVSKDESGKMMRVKQYDNAVISGAVYKQEPPKKESRRVSGDYEQDGKVIHANNDQKLVAIDLGMKDNIERGMKFEVFQIKGGGKYVSKAIIEIKEVQETISLGYIEKLYNLKEPIIPGDLISSPLYDRHAKKRFHVAGTFKKHKKEDLVKMIQESGGMVVDKIGIYTDFVVLGYKDIGTARQEAIDMGVIMLSEKDLLKYLKDEKGQKREFKKVD